MNDFDNLESLEQAQEEANNYVCPDCEEKAQVEAMMENISDIGFSAWAIHRTLQGDGNAPLKGEMVGIYPLLQQMLELQQKTVALLECIANNQRRELNN